MISDSRFVRALGFVATIFYRGWTEFMLGLEIRPKTQIGPGLTIFHGYGLVINTHAVIGARCVLRQGVTIGAKTNTGRSPRLEDGVVVGASALIIGDITIGERAVIGAGSVVTRDVPAGATVAGNPAKVIRVREVAQG